MTSTKVLKALCGAIASTLFVGLPSIVSAHEGDVHHWFEHERTRTDGGPLPLAGEALVAPPFAALRMAPSTTGGDGAPAITKRRVVTFLPDCFIEQMKASEGYIPVPCANRPVSESDQRWVVDEDKERGRHAEQARAR